LIKYLNYISYFLIIVYIVYVLNVYICIKFNYLHNLKIKILNHYINKYKIISNEKDDLIYVIKNHYLIRHMKKNNKSKILVYFVSGKEVGSADSELSKGSADAA
jgi:hypothetical protein